MAGAKQNGERYVPCAVATEVTLFYREILFTCEYKLGISCAHPEPCTASLGTLHLFFNATAKWTSPFSLVAWG